MPEEGTNNFFAVDFSFSYPITSCWSIFEDQRLVITENSWTSSGELWDSIPSGSFVYWRVRGADFPQTPFRIVVSDETWWFYKP
jgi:hypothetical protein